MYNKELVFYIFFFGLNSVRKFIFFFVYVLLGLKKIFFFKSLVVFENKIYKASVLKIFLKNNPWLTQKNYTFVVPNKNQ